MASRFWVGGTGTWDGSSTNHWASTSGGSSGASVPGSSDTVAFDGSSGGGTVTVNTTVGVQSIASGAFTGTLDFSVNNNNVTLSNSTNAWNNSGSGARTIKLGGGTITFTSSAAATIWNWATTTNLTFDAGTSKIIFGGNSAGGIQVFSGGGLTYNWLEFSSAGAGGQYQISSNNTFATLKVNAPNNIICGSNATQTITTLNVTGSASGLIILASASATLKATISIASGTPTLDWTALTNMTFSGGATFTANDSFDMGGNTGITINAPSAGSTGAPLSRVRTGM